MTKAEEDKTLSKNELVFEELNLCVNGVDLRVATVSRIGKGAPVVFLHGFGSSKEEIVDMAYHPVLAWRPFLAFDAPGCGETFCEDLSQISIPFLVDTTKAVLKSHHIQNFHLIGHSMGGLTALMLAHEIPDRTLSFIDIKGNVAPEDCFLSRQVFTYPSDDPEGFFNDFIERTRRAPSYSSALYAASLRHKVRSGAVSGIFKSMVDISDHGDLMTKFLSLPCPRLFMYGEENSSLSYLGNLKSNHVELAEIPHSGHFPMYANPVAMWDRIAHFLRRHNL